RRRLRRARAHERHPRAHLRAPARAGGAAGARHGAPARPRRRRLMAAAPRVSVVLAVHDQARWLPATLDAVAAQTFADRELVVVDDGSTDDTPGVLARRAGDARVRVLSVPHGERARARNAALAEAAGDLVAFLDGDDLWEPTKLARQVAALDAAPEAALCYTIARYVDADDRPLPIRRPPAPVGGALFATLLRANRMILSSVVARRPV